MYKSCFTICVDIEIIFYLLFYFSYDFAKEILSNLGQNIDVVLGVFDDTLLKYRQCEALELLKLKLNCAVSVHHRLAEKDKLSISDLYDENLMVIKKVGVIIWIN